METKDIRMAKPVTLGHDAYTAVIDKMTELSKNGIKTDIGTIVNDAVLAGIDFVGEDEIFYQKKANESQKTDVQDNANISNNDIDMTIMSTPWNTMATMDIVLRIADDYINRTGRIRNVNTYVLEKLPVEKNISLGYVRTLRSYGGRLKKYGLYEQALKEDWQFIKIIEKIKEKERGQQRLDRP